MRCSILVLLLTLVIRGCQAQLNGAPTQVGANGDGIFGFGGEGYSFETDPTTGDVVAFGFEGDTSATSEEDGFAFFSFVGSRDDGEGNVVDVSGEVTAEDNGEATNAVNARSDSEGVSASTSSSAESGVGGIASATGSATAGQEEQNG